MKKVLLLGLLSAFGVANAQLSKGFEASEGFVLGNLAGQQGFGATTKPTTMVVTSELAKSGANSMKMTGNNGTDHGAAGTVTTTSEVIAPIVYVNFDAYFQAATVAGEECDFFFSVQSPAESTINSRFRFTFDNKVQVVDLDPATLALAYVDTGATFTKGVWASYKMEIDFTIDEVRYYKDNVLIHTGALVGGTKVGNLAITNDNYDSSAYFDNVRYASTALATSEVSKKTVGLYPNPASEELNILTNSKVNKVTVFDATGRNIAVKYSDNKIDVRSLPIGTYFISIETKDGIVSDKFIKK